LRKGKNIKMIEWELVKTSKGINTIIVRRDGQSAYLHSRYDPYKEAKNWVDGLNIPIDVDINVVGMGLGYHIVELAKRFPQKNITVWDFNNDFAEWLIQSQLITEVLHLPNVEYKYTSSLHIISETFTKYLNSQYTVLIIYRPCMLLIPEHLESLKEALLNYNMFYQTLKDTAPYLYTNFQKNMTLNDKGISMTNLHHGDKMILVSAGPSLTKQLPKLKEISIYSNVQIGCVGTALKPLLTYGIKPSFVMVTDPHPTTIEQFEGIRLSDVPLFYLSTAAHNVVKDYAGPRYIVWQKGFELAERMAAEKKEPLIETGGSVATSLISLMVTLGAKCIALIGQDLAYTNGLTHAEQAPSQHRITVQHQNNLLVDRYDLKGKIETSRSLYLYLKWFESHAENYRERVKFINCTEGGAYIKGFEHMPFEQFIKMYIST
jgi:hypothetical protein